MSHPTTNNILRGHCLPHTWALYCNTFSNCWHIRTPRNIPAERYRLQFAILIYLVSGLCNSLFSVRFWQRSSLYCFLGLLRYFHLSIAPHWFCSSTRLILLQHLGRRCKSVRRQFFILSAFPTFRLLLTTLDRLESLQRVSISQHPLLFNSQPVQKIGMNWMDHHYCSF